MTKQEAVEFMQGVYQGLVKKSKLILEVSIDDVTQAEQLIDWLYNEDKPVLAELHSIHFDSVVISRTDYEKLLQVKSLFQSSI